MLLWIDEEHHLLALLEPEPLSNRVWKVHEAPLGNRRNRRHHFGVILSHAEYVYAPAE